MARVGGAIVGLLLLMLFLIVVLGNMLGTLKTH
jgi:hypothetical protein